MNLAVLLLFSLVYGYVSVSMLSVACAPSKRKRPVKKKKKTVKQRSSTPDNENNTHTTYEPDFTTTNTQDVQTIEGTALSKIKYLAQRLLFREKRRRIDDQKRRRELKRRKKAQAEYDNAADSSMSFLSEKPNDAPTHAKTPDIETANGTKTKASVIQIPPCSARDVDITITKTPAVDKLTLKTAPSDAERLVTPSDRNKTTTRQSSGKQTKNKPKKTNPTQYTRTTIADQTQEASNKARRRKKTVDASIQNSIEPKTQTVESPKTKKGALKEPKVVKNEKTRTSGSTRTMSGQKPVSITADSKISTKPITQKNKKTE